MSDLSEERKRQIREEEEQRLRRVKAEEDAYREQVRRQLESGPVPPPAQAPVPPVQPPPSAPPAQAVPPASMPAQPKPQEPKPPKPKRPRKARLAFGAVWSLGGLALAYYAYSQGFPVPGLDGPFRADLTADDAGTPQPTDDAKWDKSALAYDDWELADGKVVRKPDSGKPPAGRATGTATPSGTSGTGGTGDVPPTATESAPFSVTVPSSWAFDEKSKARWIVSRALEGGSRIRANFTDVSDRAAYSADDLHAEAVAYVQNWVNTPGGLKIEATGSENTASGLALQFTTFSDPARPDYYYVAMSVSNGKHAVWVVLDGPEDIPDEVDGEVEALVKSLRLGS